MDPATITLALSLVSQGMTMWADRLDTIAKGSATDADVQTWADELGLDIATLRAEANRQRAEGKQP